MIARPTGAWWATRWFALFAVLATAVPLLWPPLPPLTDLPAQLGRYKVMLGDADAQLLSAWYRFQWHPIGYLGVDLLVAGLAPLVGLEPAVKAVIIVVPMLMTAAMLWISHEAHGRVQPMTVLALPFAYHLAFQFGFLNYALAVALALAGLALWLRLGRQARFGLRAGVFIIVGAVVWTAHVFGWLILGLLVFASELARQRAAGQRWPVAIVRGGIGCLPLALPAVMFLGWRPGNGATGSDWRESLALKPGWLVMALRDRWRWFDLASMLLVAVMLYRAVRSRAHAHAPPLAIGALLLLALFVAIPFGSAYGDARIAALVWIVALLAIRSDGTAGIREQAAIALIGLALFGARTAAATASFAIESGVWARHLAALDPHPARQPPRQLRPGALRARLAAVADGASAERRARAARRLRQRPARPGQCRAVDRHRAGHRRFRARPVADRDGTTLSRKAPNSGRSTRRWRACHAIGSTASGSSMRRRSISRRLRGMRDHLAPGRRFRAGDRPARLVASAVCGLEAANAAGHHRAGGANRPLWWQTRSFVLIAALIAAVPLIRPQIPPLVDLPGSYGPLPGAARYRRGALARRLV